MTAGPSEQATEFPATDQSAHRSAIGITVRDEVADPRARIVDGQVDSSFAVALLDPVMHVKV